MLYLLGLVQGVPLVAGLQGVLVGVHQEGQEVRRAVGLLQLQDAIQEAGVGRQPALLQDPGGERHTRGEGETPGGREGLVSLKALLVYVARGTFITHVKVKMESPL